jgi:hypothetical protein
MMLMTWLYERLGWRSRSDKRYEAALSDVDEVTVAARSLREQIEPYKMSRDPFAAMVHAREIADSNNRQSGLIV